MTDDDIAKAYDLHRELTNGLAGNRQTFLAGVRAALIHVRANSSISPTSKWSDEPPTEPGWYWWRSEGNDPDLYYWSRLGEWNDSAGTHIPTHEMEGGQWCPVQEPPA